MSEQQKKVISICVWSTVIFFGLLCALSLDNIISSPSIYDLFGYAGKAISIAIIFAGLYEKFFWRFDPFEKTPKLAKRYVGSIKSSYDNTERKAVLEIRQTLMSVHITLTTDESTSNSLVASIDEIMGRMQLTYCYLNTPKSEFRHRSEIHYGTVMLSITDPASLVGQYYTDRKTTGDMLFTVDNNS